MANDYYKEKDPNPMLRSPGCLLWIVFFPLAFVLMVIFECRIDPKQRKLQKRRKKEYEKWKKEQKRLKDLHYFDVWQDNQGL